MEKVGLAACSTGCDRGVRWAWMLRALPLRLAPSSLWSPLRMLLAPPPVLGRLGARVRLGSSLMGGAGAVGSDSGSGRDGSAPNGPRGPIESSSSDSRVVLWARLTLCRRGPRVLEGVGREVTGGGGEAGSEGCDGGALSTKSMSEPHEGGGRRASFMFTCMGFLAGLCEVVVALRATGDI